MAILCPHCQSEIGQESKFCPECGTRMPGKSRSSQGDGVTLNGCGTDVAVKDFPHSGLTSEMRQKVSVVAAEEKQRVAKFVEGLADATRLLQERRLVSCRRQVDGLLQLQGQLDVVDDPDCAKTMPAARVRLAALPHIGGEPTIVLNQFHDIILRLGSRFCKAHRQATKLLLEKKQITFDTIHGLFSQWDVEYGLVSRPKSDIVCRIIARAFRWPMPRGRFIGWDFKPLPVDYVAPERIGLAESINPGYRGKASNGIP